MADQDIVTRARDFATLRHGAQLRKYDGTPYTLHLARVAEMVEGVGGTPEMIAAAWLHDTLEDTSVDYGELITRFGIYTAGLVDVLTDDTPLEVGNRCVRKALYRSRLKDGSPAAKTIKLADLIDNTRSIVAHNPKFAKIYLAEKRDLLEVLGAGDRRLLEEARRLAHGSTYWKG